MDIILLAKILAVLEWQNLNTHKEHLFDYINSRYPDILRDTQSEFSHLYLEL